MLGISLYNTFNFEDSYDCLKNVYKADTIDSKVTTYLARVCYELKKDKECLQYIDKTFNLLKIPNRVLYLLYDLQSKTLLADKQYAKA